MLEFVEEALNAVTQLVGDGVVRNEDFPRPIGRNDGFGTDLSDEVPQRIAIIGFVGDDAARGQAGEQVRGARNVGGLSRRQNEADGATLGIGDGVDLRRQSSSGTPHSLILGPPFPVAACWWTRTSVLSSIRYWLSGSPVSDAKTLSQTPFLAHRVKRLWTLFHLPYRSGRSCQCAPDRKTHKT